MDLSKVGRSDHPMQGTNMASHGLSFAENSMEIWISCWYPCFRNTKKSRRPVEHLVSSSTTKHPMSHSAAQRSTAQHSAAQRTPFRKHNFKENMQSNTAANHSSGSRSFAELLKKQLHHQPLWDCCGALGSLTPVVKTASTNLSLSLSVKFLFFSANRVL